MAVNRPERVLYGLLWLTGLWCSLRHARLGLPLDEIVEDSTTTARSGR